MEIPDDKGTYILFVGLGTMKRLEIGRLGAFAAFRWFQQITAENFESGLAVRQAVFPSS